jgi:hypothetical protein
MIRDRVSVYPVRNQPPSLLKQMGQQGGRHWESCDMSVSRRHRVVTAMDVLGLLNWVTNFVIKCGS